MSTALLNCPYLSFFCGWSNLHFAGVSHFLAWFNATSRFLSTNPHSSHVKEPPNGLGAIHPISSHSSSMTRSASAYGSCSTVPGDPGLGWSWRLTSAAMLPLSRKNTMPQPRLQWNDHAMLCDALPDLYNSIQIYTMPNCRTTVVSGCFGFFFPMDLRFPTPLALRISPSVVRPSLSPPRWCPSLRWARSPAIFRTQCPSAPVPQCPSALDGCEYHCITALGRILKSLNIRHSWDRSTSHWSCWVLLDFEDIATLLFSMAKWGSDFEVECSQVPTVKRWWVRVGAQNWMVLDVLGLTHLHLQILYELTQSTTGPPLLEILGALVARNRDPTWLGDTWHLFQALPDLMVHLASASHDRNISKPSRHHPGSVYVSLWYDPHFGTWSAHIPPSAPSFRACTFLGRWPKPGSVGVYYWSTSTSQDGSKLGTSSLRILNIKDAKDG